MPQRPIISIIIPVRREEEAIITTLDSLKMVHTPHEIIVVSDRVDRADQTEHIVSRYKGAVRLVRKKIGKEADGFAGALFRGVRALKTPYVVFVMADLCDDPKTIDIMYQTIRNGWDVACGSRYMHGGKKIGGPLLQGFFSWVVNTLLHRVAGIPTTDASNSFKMYRREIIEKIRVDDSMGVEASLAIIIEAHRWGARITDVPTTWLGRTKGISKFHFFRQFVRYSRIFIAAMR